MERVYQEELKNHKKTSSKFPLKKEHGARICKRICKYYVGRIGTSHQEKVLYMISIPPCEKGDKTIGYIHSHPGKDSSASDHDSNIMKYGYPNNTKITLSPEAKLEKYSTNGIVVRDKDGNIELRVYYFRNNKRKQIIYINGQD